MGVRARCGRNMSVKTGWDTAESKVDCIAGDRRTDKRYDIGLALRWKLVRRRKVLDEGSGRTLDISSGGIRFDSGRVLPVGLNIELIISWPVLLHQVGPLQLVVTGRIIRSKGTQAAIRKTQHEFQCTAASVDEHVPLGARLVTSAREGDRARLAGAEKVH